MLVVALGEPLLSRLRFCETILKSNLHESPSFHILLIRSLISAVCAASAVDFFAISRQGLVLVFLSIDVGTHICWHGTSQFVVLEFQDFQKGKILQGEWNCARELIVVQPDTTETLQRSHLRGNFPLEGAVGEGEGGQFCEMSNFSWNSAGQSVGIQPHGNC
jgi:hypothetical protein